MEDIKAYVDSIKKTGEKFVKRTLGGLRTIAYVEKVYDGDTFTAVAYTGTKYEQFQVRLLGIDTPELRNVSAEEKARGIRARDYLRSLILNKYVHLEVEGECKYGRALAHVNLLETDEQINRNLYDGSYENVHENMYENSHNSNTYVAALMHKAGHAK